MKALYTLKDVYLDRLEKWKLEKETNQNGMAHVADRCIKVLEKDIKRLFPEESE